MLSVHPLATLKKRSAFLAVAAGGAKWVTPGVIVQIKPQPREQDDKTATARRLGLTASKRVGNAVARNRARRRLRALAHDMLPKHAAADHDYVLIARPETVTRDYDSLRNDLITALKRLKVWRD